MAKSRYSYNELLEACKDPTNKGKNNPITIVKFKDDNCEFQFVGDKEIRQGSTALLVNGAVDEMGVITNPESLKDWDGFSKIDSY